VQSQVPGMMGQANSAQAMAQYYYQEQEKNLAETQLEVDSIKSEIYHLLRQDVLRTLPDGNQKWEQLTNDEQRTLTDWGVDRIMKMIHFYINKNTLLSNFDEKQIKMLMYRFVGELNDLVLLKYEVLFRRPTLEECQIILNQRLDEKRKLRMFAAEILGTSLDHKQVQKEILNEMEGRIEQEISKIREQQRKEKIREYGMIMSQLEAMVFATYNRAWRGEERGSIRRHTNISEIIGGRSAMPGGDKGGMLKWLRSS
jgi:hypothetical protein